MTRKRYTGKPAATTKDGVGDALVEKKPVKRSRALSNRKKGRPPMDACENRGRAAS